MILKKWEDLPEALRTDAVLPYYDALKKKQGSLICKRLFDVALSALLLLLLSPLFLVLAVAIKLDSPGTVFFRQQRVTCYGKNFRIFKFRSMVSGADKLGSQVTVGNDSRITRMGRLIRKCRLDELCQLIDVFRGTMTFVGTRPEVPKYGDAYTPEMMATLLLPAGVTSLASIMFKDEDQLLEGVEDVDLVYVRDILPEKMRYNLKALKEFSFFGDIKVMFMTIFAVLGKEYSEKDSPDE